MFDCFLSFVSNLFEFWKPGTIYKFHENWNKTYGTKSDLKDTVSFVSSVSDEAINVCKGF
jgi:hypothetical protein